MSNNSQLKLDWSNGPIKVSYGDYELICSVNKEYTGTAWYYSISLINKHVTILLRSERFLPTEFIARQMAEEKLKEFKDFCKVVVSGSLGSL